MVDSQLQFDQRLQLLSRKRQSLSRGYTTRLRSDGLIVLKPKRAQSRISARSVMLFLAAFFLFKGFLMASLGEQTYNDRITQLRGGTMVEQAGAVLMQIEPLSQTIAQKIGPVIR